MSSGHVSHKGNATKNTNRNGLIDPDPANVPTEADYSRNDRDVTPVNSAATERPEDKPDVEQE